MRDKWQFKVGGGLTIRNILFDGIDSTIMYTDDTNGCLSNKLSSCCSVSGTVVTGTSSCSSAVLP